MASDDEMAVGSERDVVVGARELSVVCRWACCGFCVYVYECVLCACSRLLAVAVGVWGCGVYFVGCLGVV